MISDHVKADEFYQSLEKVRSACFLCQSDTLTMVLENDRYGMGLSTCLCEKCGFLFTNPHPTQGQMNHFYAKNYRLFYTGSTNPEKEYLEDLHIQKRQWLCQQVKDLLTSNPSVNAAQPHILDVGCGAGVLLHVFRQAFPKSQLYGVEPYDVFAKYTEARSQAKVFVMDIDQFSQDKNELKGTIDLLTLNHVLEHLYYPIEKLIALREYLKPGGYLMIQVPNLLSAYWKKKLGIFHIAHINHFTPMTLRRTLLAAGFQTIKEHPISLPVHHTAMTFVCQKTNTPIPSRSVVIATPEELAQNKKSILKVIRQAKWSLGITIQRIKKVMAQRGASYLCFKLVFHTRNRVLTYLKPLQLGYWNRYDSIRGHVDHLVNHKVLSRLIAGQKVLVLGSGPSAGLLKHIPKDVKILTCNAGLRLFDSNAIFDRPPDLFLCRKKAMVQDYPDIPNLLKKVGAGVLVVDTTFYIRLMDDLRGRYKHLIRDHQKDNFYLKQIAKPLVKKKPEPQEVTWSSAGIRLLQYALHFKASEIYLAGIDLNEHSYFWGKPFVNKHPIDLLFIQYVAQHHKHVYSAIPESPTSAFLPVRSIENISSGSLINSAT